MCFDLECELVFSFSFLCCEDKIATTTMIYFFLFCSLSWEKPKTNCSWFLWVSFFSVKTTFVRFLLMRKNKTSGFLFASLWWDRFWENLFLNSRCCKEKKWLSYPLSCQLEGFLIFFWMYGALRPNNLRTSSQVFFDTSTSDQWFCHRIFNQT